MEDAQLHHGDISVVMFIQSYIPFIGGAERQLQNWTRFFPAQRVRTTIITRRHPGPEYVAFSQIEGADVFRMKLVGGHVLKAVSYTVGALFRLWRLRQKVDVLYAHGLLSPTTTAVLGKIALRRPVVVKLLAGGKKGDIPLLLSKPLGRLRLEIFKRMVDRFVCISQEIQKQLLAAGIPAEKLVSIPNGVDTDVFSPASAQQRERLRTTLQLPAGRLILFVGRLVPQKGLETLVAAWPEVYAAQPEANLLIIGDGPLRPFLEDAHLPNVSLLGIKKDMVPYFQAADIFVLPSRFEGLSNALLEAMAVGLPCVVTNVGAAPELIENGKEGLIVPPEEPAALRDALLRVLRDEPFAKQSGEAARQRIVQNYSLQSVVLRLRRLFEEMRFPRQV